MRLFKREERMDEIGGVNFRSPQELYVQVSDKLFADLDTSAYAHAVAAKLGEEASPLPAEAAIIPDSYSLSFGEPDDRDHTEAFAVSPTGLEIELGTGLAEADIQAASWHMNGAEHISTKPRVGEPSVDGYVHRTNGPSL